MLTVNEETFSERNYFLIASKLQPMNDIQCPTKWFTEIEISQWTEVSKIPGSFHGWTFRDRSFTSNSCQIPMGKGSAEQESWNGVGYKSSQEIKGSTHQKPSEEKANKSLSTVYCNCACKLTNKPHFYHFKRYVVNIYITLYASLGFIWCLKFNKNLQLKGALDPRWWPK